MITLKETNSKKRNVYVENSIIIILVCSKLELGGHVQQNIKLPLPHLVSMCYKFWLKGISEQIMEQYLAIIF